MDILISNFLSKTNDYSTSLVRGRQIGAVTNLLFPLTHRESRSRTVEKLLNPWNTLLRGTTQGIKIICLHIQQTFIRVHMHTNHETCTGSQWLTHYYTELKSTNKISFPLLFKCYSEIKFYNTAVHAIPSFKSKGILLIHIFS